jgi:hypothetical protein
MVSPIYWFFFYDSGKQIVDDVRHVAQGFPLIRNDNMSNADLKRHLKSKHGQQKFTLKQQQPYTLTPEQQQHPPPYPYTGYD